MSGFYNKFNQIKKFIKIISKNLNPKKNKK